MDKNQLEALATYKSHNGIRRPCDCETCKLARQILKAMDEKLKGWDAKMDDPNDAMNQYCARREWEHDRGSNTGGW